MRSHEDEPEGVAQEARKLLEAAISKKSPFYLNVLADGKSNSATNTTALGLCEVIADILEELSARMPQFYLVLACLDKIVDVSFEDKEGSVH